MNNQLDTTTNGVNLPAVKEMRDTLPALLQTHLPWMQEKHDRAEALLDEITPIKDDEELEDAIAKLAAVSKVYSAISEKRKQMTEITDAFKDIVMEYERPFNTDAKSKSKYIERRKYVEDYQQKKLDDRRKQEQEAAKRKELENLKVDLRAKILLALNQNVTDTIKRADDYARNLFATLEVENFDAHAEQFKKQKPKLDIKTYNKLFEQPYPSMSKEEQLLPPGDYKLFIEDIQREETYDKWNAAIQEAVAPVLNEWRAKIPDLKAECIAKSKASAEEKVRLEEERKKRDEEEREKKQKEIDQAAFIKSAEIQDQANTEKIGNEFQAQAATQNMADGGAVKLVAKFTDPKTTPKALMSVMYHVFSSEKFQGIQKRDSKTKKLLFDDKGRPIYIDAIQWWLDQYVRDCNASVEGLQLFEDSKVTIRN